MRDLKHLIYFESLLENADNDLVKQAQTEGKLAIGYTCYHMPEPLLNLPGCFSVRLRAPRTGSLDIATYYMSNYTCEYARALVERGMEGGYQFLDALAGVDACSMMNRAMEHFEILQMNDKPNFFVTHCDIPYKITDYTLDSYVKQMRRRLLEPLAAFFRDAIAVSKLSGVYTGPLLKCMSISILTMIGESLCKDAGQAAGACAVQLVGVAAALYAALPLMRTFLTMIGECL